MTDSHSPDFSDRQDALRAMAQPREGEVEFWNRQRESIYGPIEDDFLSAGTIFQKEIYRPPSVEPMKRKRLSFFAWVWKFLRE